MYYTTYYTAYDYGWMDFEDGFYLDENPYSWGTWEYEDWREGWLDSEDAYYYYGYE